MARALPGAGGLLIKAVLLVVALIAGVAAPASAADPSPFRSGDVRWALYPRLVVGGGGLGFALTHKPSRVHFDLTADARALSLAAPRITVSPPNAGLFPLARIRPRFAVGIGEGVLELAVDVGLLAEASAERPVMLDGSVVVPWLRGDLDFYGSPEEGLRLSVRGAVEALGAATMPSGASIPALVQGGGRARVSFARWMSTGLPLKDDDFVLSDPESPAPVMGNAAPIILLFADAHPTGGVYLDAWVDVLGGTEGAGGWSADGVIPVQSRLRAEIVASAPLPLPVPGPVFGALEFQGVLGVAPTDAPYAAELPYPGALTRDGRNYRGDSLMKMRFALRFPIGPPPPPAPNLMLFGPPTIQVDAGFGDTWGYACDGDGCTRRLPFIDPGDAGVAAGEVGFEFRLPMAWMAVDWTLWTRLELGIRSGEGAGPQGDALDQPWFASADRRIPIGFALGLGVPIR